MKGISKDDIKRICSEQQGHLDALTGEPLPLDEQGNLILNLVDLDRIIPGSEGGKYTIENCRVLLPKTHIYDLHKNSPDDDPELVELKKMMKGYRNIQQLRKKIVNQKLASERFDLGEIGVFEDMIKNVEKRESEIEKEITKKIKLSERPIIKILMSVRDIGALSVADLVTTLNPHKAEYPSSFWKYVGYAGPSSERTKKGVKGGGNKSLRTRLYIIGSQFLRKSNQYYEPIYRRRRAHTEIVLPWNEKTKAHCHLDANRVMMKHFLAHLWHVWRELEGLPTRPIYAEGQLAGNHDTEDPRDFGWEW